MSCIFCNNTSPKLFENKHAYSLLSFSPASPGHFLTISSRHVTALSQRRGDELSGLFLCLDKSFTELNRIIKEDRDFFSEFYNRLVENPPFIYSEEYSEKNKSCLQKMLEMCADLPEPFSYNMGMNMGRGAGQRESHIHLHVIPRCGEGLGIVNAMRNMLLK